MITALISDIHANLPALEAVLDHARARGAEEIWNCGDSVGYGPDPEAVMARLRAERAVSIVGNYDLKVLKVERKRSAWRRTKHPLKLASFAWAFARLGAESRADLAALPRQRRLAREGVRCLLVHGSPDSIDEHLWPSTPDDRLAELAPRADADLVACGHSHRAFAREAAGVLWVNAGSVGRPDDGDPRTGYALLRFARGRVEVRPYRLDYDLARAVAAIRARGLPEAFARMLTEGRNLEDVLPGG